MPPRDGKQRVAALDDDGDRLGPVHSSGRWRCRARAGREQGERRCERQMAQRAREGGGQARVAVRLHPESHLL
jgi:hypothetical protein